jgi:hypothetical protein
VKSVDQECAKLLIKVKKIEEMPALHHLEELPGQLQSLHRKLGEESLSVVVIKSMVSTLTDKFGLLELNTDHAISKVRSAHQELEREVKDKGKSCGPEILEIRKIHDELVEAIKIFQAARKQFYPYASVSSFDSDQSCDSSSASADLGKCRTVIDNLADLLSEKLPGDGSQIQDVKALTNFVRSLKVLDSFPEDHIALTGQSADKPVGTGVDVVADSPAVEPMVITPGPVVETRMIMYAPGSPPSPQPLSPIYVGPSTSSLIGGSGRQLMIQQRVEQIGEDHSQIRQRLLPRDSGNPEEYDDDVFADEVPALQPNEPGIEGSAYQEDQEDQEDQEEEEDQQVPETWEDIDVDDDSVIVPPGL